MLAIDLRQGTIGGGVSSSVSALRRQRLRRFGADCIEVRHFPLKRSSRYAQHTPCFGRHPDLNTVPLAVLIDRRLIPTRLVFATQPKFSSPESLT